LLNINSVPKDFGKVGWNLGARVTLIGDAVHVVEPTSGSRAIVALRDAATLCRMLVGGTLTDVAGVIKRYETEMQDYAT
jgi:2-polyprenyl-6-methoxyphenol hydroxylase-like FAD-dependent oxidoreductase